MFINIRRYNRLHHAQPINIVYITWRARNFQNLLTETFLDSSISSEDPRQAIKGYKLFRCDNPSNLRRGGVCLYFKDHLSLALRPDLTTLDEYLVCEVQNGSKRFFLTVLYRSPSQSNEQFSLFRQRWEETIININDCSPTIAIYIRDFNARNSEWWNGDSTNLQGTELAELVAQYSLNQIIDGPTHILPNSVSGIDLIFTTETNFVTDSGVLPSLFPRCHHQLIFEKVSFTTFFSSCLRAENLGLTPMLSGKLLVALIGIGGSTA